MPARVRKTEPPMKVIDGEKGRERPIILSASNSIEGSLKGKTREVLETLEAIVQAIGRASAVVGGNGEQTVSVVENGQSVDVTVTTVHRP